MRKLLILGAGGHGRVVAETALLMGVWSDIAFLDDNTVSINEPVVGGLSMYSEFDSNNTSFMVAIGNNSLRMSWLRRLEANKNDIPVIIHPSAIISKKADIGLGTVVLAGSVINSNASLGNGCIINTQSSVDHDCILHDGVHLSPGVHLGGTVTIGSQTWIGIGASVVNNVSIGRDSVIAAGATVTNDIPSFVMAAGVPAIVKKHLGAE